jgi:hypothetical protein
MEKKIRMAEDVAGPSNQSSFGDVLSEAVHTLHSQPFPSPVPSFNQEQIFINQPPSTTNSNNQDENSVISQSLAPFNLSFSQPNLEQNYTNNLNENSIVPLNIVQNSPSLLESIRNHIQQATLDTKQMNVNMQTITNGQLNELSQISKLLQLVCENQNQMLLILTNIHNAVNKGSEKDPNFEIVKDLQTKDDLIKLNDRLKTDVKFSSQMVSK